jgi:hypothetical protein
VPKFFALGEDGVNEAIGCLVDLALGEWPELDRLHSPGQRVGQRAKA